MKEYPFGEDSVSTSKFYMLRCIIAMAHADGIVCDEEIAYISAIMNRIALTDEQRDILEGDFKEEQNISKLFAHINDPRYRGQAVYFARILAHKDGNLDPSEQDLIDRFQKLATDGLDIETIRADAKKAVEAELFMHDIQIDKNRPTKHGHFIPYIQWLDEVLLHLGIDLMR